jgi:hypothetical protein
MERAQRNPPDARDESTQRAFDEFEHQARQTAAPSLLRESWEFVRHTGKWWLLPVLFVLLLLGLLILLSGTAAAPFIYTLF